MILYIFSILSTILFILVLLVKRFMYFRPSTIILEKNEHFIDTYEGELHGWYKQGTLDTIILYCHGNTGNISDRQDNLSKIIKLGHSVLIFDYNGYGRSRGIPNEQLCYSNAYTFVEFLLKKGYKKDNIIPYGEDIGSAVAIYTGLRYNLPKVIIVSGIPNINKIIENKLWILKIFKFLFSEFDTEYYIKNYKGTVLVLHSTQDEIIDYNYMKNLPCILVPIKGTHNKPEINWDIINNFIQK